MAQTTSRLALSLPGGGSHGDIIPPDTADIDDINDDLRKLEAAVGWILVTSVTHPTNPYLGMPIYETDTGNGFLWNGGTWVKAVDTNQLNRFTGTSIARDAYYGAPGTGTSTPEITARATLANKGARWYNTDLGWEEQYYAKVGDTGAANGSVAKTPGWYPSGRGVVPTVGLTVPSSTYNIGTSLVTTQANLAQLWRKNVGFADIKLDGTGSGARMVIPIEGNYRVEAYGRFNSSTINLMMKLNSVTADSAGVCAGDSGNGVNSDNFRGFSSVNPFAKDDFLTIGWYASTAGAYSNLRWLVTWDGVRTS